MDRDGYILEQYKRIDILKMNFESENWFNPNIYTNDGYIPFCSSCKEDYEMFKKSDIYENMEVEIKDPQACLWYQWYITRILNICPSVKIVKNKTKNKN